MLQCKLFLSENQRQSSARLHPLEGLVSVENTTTQHLPVETMHKPAKDHRLSSKASKGSALVAINKCVFFMRKTLFVF